MAGREESAVFTPRQSLCRTPPSGVTVLDDLPTFLCPVKGSAKVRAKKIRRRSRGWKLYADTERTERTGSKLNKADINSVAPHGHEILAVVAALNLHLAEAELEVANSRLEAANARLEASRTG
ncbi:hypothetical protein EVAR_87169_1 [Eumeta japonica]|uniref:Uncharacterized protein n=1 Tax=Eumeta variegata TaxID=151549 RepID=A0A4C1VU24_EUMVA|nr:hypothetical protein EVAR_87169_1 [Eumeta japonica]